MTDVYVAFYGLPHLVGQKVSAFVGGLDCGDYVVDTLGAIYVPIGADPGGLFTGTYLASIDGYVGEQAASVTVDGSTYTVPVVIGTLITTQGQLMRPVSEADVKSPLGSGLAKTRRITQIGAMFTNTIQVSLGSNFTTKLLPSVFTSIPGALETVLPTTDMFTGVYWAPEYDDPGFDGQGAWQTLRPGPLTVNAITVFIDTSEH
jgi:hypothetical protein